MIISILLELLIRKIKILTTEKRIQHLSLINYLWKNFQ